VRLPQRNLALRLSLVLGVAALLAALLQSLLVGTIAGRQIEVDIGGRLADLSAHMVDTLDRGMFERYRDIQILATLEPIRDPSTPPAARQALLETLQRTYPDYAWIGITDPAGTVAASTGGALLGENVAARPWFQAAQERPFVGDVHEAVLLAKLLPSPDGEPLRFVDIAVPLRDEQGRFIGVLGAHLSWSWAREVRASVLAPTQAARGVEIIVARADGQVVLGPPDLLEQPLALPSVAAARQGMAGVRAEEWPDGITYLVSFQQSRGYRDYPGLGWLILVRQPVTQAFAPAVTVQWQLVGGLLAMATLLIVLAGVMIGRSTRPLRQIAAVADRLRVNHHDGALPLVRGEDEVARLAHSLRALLASLLQQEQHLADANARLRQELLGRSAAEAEARRQAVRANTLARIAATLNAQLELPSVLQTVCAETAAVLGTNAAVVRLYNPDTDELELAAAVGMPEAYQAQLAAVPRALYAPVLESRTTAVVTDLQTLPRPYVDAVQAADLRGSLAVSLRRGGQLLGVLTSVTTTAPDVFDDEAHTMLRSIADHASQAIANARSYDQARRRLAQVQALRSIDVAITSSQDLTAILATCVRQVREQLAVDAAVVLRYDATNQWLLWGAGEGLRFPVYAPLALPAAHTMPGRAIRERRRVDLQELSGMSGEQRFATWLDHESVAGYYAVPLIANGVVLGVLEVLHRAPLAPDQEWFDFLDTLAGQIALAMAHVELFANLNEANDALVRAYDTTIEGWSRALDLRDKETEGHSQRVTALTLQLAMRLGVPDEALIPIRRGALLHDIGKMGVPDQILLKPGPLDDAEWVIMRRHPVYAYELLSPIAYLRPALDIPYSHHEKWNGTGYPQGLAGEQIPLAARLFAVVDVWDAITNERPYKAAHPPEWAMAFIIGAAGTHFDPNVVAAFVELMRERGVHIDA
jgi:HD-GYP domain-containing protein (c-di-GMP phosphodiesterase class II)/putative methionine-R-sulfoxide reductase with GAF domain